ncbi:hypothetical protein AVEN_99684-1 [Araneus ventricosus]|uniref:Uncharacterized protein n=1 Tax=Araneus ventricosus TaxID=182803 RepID=A0A4Y2DLY5_ARAVE|nr:hypothetical protein AVEN_99684-1 [Araneus ventricosus]
MDARRGGPEYVLHLLCLFPASQSKDAIRVVRDLIPVVDVKIGLKAGITQYGSLNNAIWMALCADIGN